jgi:carboxyl-terminal processing protease
LLVLTFVLGTPLFQTPVFARADSGSATPGVSASTNTESSVIHFDFKPGPLDGKIAFVTAGLLEQIHYSKQPFDRTVSSKFFDHYLEALDPQHLHFLQSDLAQFEKYRTTLGDITINRRRDADTRPAGEIFSRFLERFQQRVAYVDELLKNEKFAFDTDERIAINRHELPYPKNLDEAKQLWRQRLRYEYLQEHLSKIDKKKNAKKDANKPAAAPGKSEAQEITDVLTHLYHRSLRNFTNWTSDDVLQVYLDTLTHVYDPHSDYMGSASLGSFAISMNLALSGIGAELTSEDGYCTIRRLLDGPAMKSRKIKEKDRIVAVAQGDKPPIDVVDMNLNKVVQLIRGPKGSEVRLTVLPAGAAASETNVVALIRDEVKIEDSAAKANVIEVPNSQGETVRLGVIDLPSFYAPFDFAGTRKPGDLAGDQGGGHSTTADVSKLIRKLEAEKVRGIVLDLRRNGGGSLEEAVKLTGLFIEKGPVVQVKDWRGNIEEERDEDSSVLYDGPLIVLTSRFSASASEILAGALQDYGRALIVGDSSTHGKGTVQSVNGLRGYIDAPPSMLATNDPGAVKMTIKKFYRASGASTQLHGVTPDIILPSLANESKDIGESSLDDALGYDEIKSAKYDKLNMVEPYVPELKKRSTQRIATDKDFAYLREDIETFKKQQADKTISLNEKDRLKEKEEMEARIKARDKERKARKETAEKVYDVTLKLADLPGLPAPTQKTNTTSTASASTGGASVDQEDSLDEPAPGPDLPLVEAEHILMDYMRLLPKSTVVTTARSGQPVN